MMKQKAFFITFKGLSFEEKKKKKKKKKKEKERKKEERKWAVALFSKF